MHGGGFYHINKYLVAPEFLPEHLTWFKWESYFTWLSGFVLLAMVYYAGADLYLVDRTCSTCRPGSAIADLAGVHRRRLGGLRFAVQIAASANRPPG